MHATVLPAIPAPLNRPTAVLTERGYTVLAFIREQDALAATDVAGRDRLDRQISALLDAVV